MIKNLEEALRPLRNLQAHAREAANRAELTVAERIAESARIAAPGSLGGKISVSQTGQETIIDAGDELSAYVEFGTGDTNVLKNFATFGNDPILTKEAKKFFVSGEGTLLAHPFFFPAIYEHRDELIPEIEKELQKETK
jgi:hypothetical protein